jgi:chemotaxis methyl-accepting protein methylase
MPSAGRALPHPAPDELCEDDARELEALMAQVHRDAGFFCAGYKEKCLRRRLAIRMRARGVHRYADYGALLSRDRGEYEKLLAVLTINVSKFFRNAEVWALLGREVLPALFALEVPRVRVWSAAAAAGEEAYTAAILIREYAEMHGAMERLGRFELLGSDIDREVLDLARRGEYGESAFAEMPPATRQRWFGAPPKNALAEEIRRMVHFEPLDLLTAPLPERQHLIFCRNVTIYFERAVQEALLERLRASLVPGGFLVLGKVEALLGPIAKGFRTVGNQERIYQCL